MHKLDSSSADADDFRPPDADAAKPRFSTSGGPASFWPGAFDYLALGGAVNRSLAAVGCESCHGAGGDHVAPGAPRTGTILSLGDKCDTCVILKICGTCHDDANDPGFEFEVQDKIDTLRHGTIEASVSRRARRPIPCAANSEASRQ